MKYRVLGTNNIEKFVQIMMRCKVSHHTAMTVGVDEDKIDEINRLAIKREVVILTLPEGVITGDSKEKVFIFVPKDISSDKYFGVFIPIPSDKKPYEYGSFIQAPIEDTEIVKDISSDINDSPYAMGKTPEEKPIEFKGRPKRKNSINNADESRLKILLNNTDSVDEFLKCLD